MNNLSMNSNPLSKKITRLYFEQQLWSQGHTYVMGLDEVGRGCLAGPVVAAGVIFPKDIQLIEHLRDSKKVSEADRVKLAEQIKTVALFYSVQFVDPTVIDQINILKASFKAMLKCVEAAEHKGMSPNHLLVDGNRFAPSLIPFTCIVKGDDRSQSIAAASILAKVARDDYMRDLHAQWPEYGWDTNVGYPSAKHKKAILTHGITEHHRRSFKLGNTFLRKKMGGK